ncbi:MAG: AAA family ATPase, partial [Actinobacteria bacterium]|nr:AAA family ATPase [Actinomycetota bacterium]
MGPLEVYKHGQPLPLGAPKQRALLLLLLLEANNVVTSSRLVENLWSGATPRTAPTALQGYVSALRKLLGADRVVTRSNGYLLRARAALRDALVLWRGEALAELAETPFGQRERVRLGELHLGVLEQRINADLEAGHHAELIGELEALVREHPLREPLHALLMLALYRTGRRAEALSVYEVARRQFLHELEIEPGHELQNLQRRMSGHDPSLRPAGRRPDQTISPSRGTREPSPDRSAEPSRRTVTVVFSDIVGSTELATGLDPEVWREMMRRYFDTVATVLERHGGTVEKFIGDAVMAVFGVPRVREDDALRAVRAAAAMRVSVARLSNELRAGFGIELRIRTGVNTGEVIAGDPGSGQTLATGDALVVAQRLEQAAHADEILLGPKTHELVRDAIVARATEPLPLKGIGELTAWRVLEVLPDTLGVSRHFDAPLVGRACESALLRAALDRAVAERSCQLVTVLGTAGIGKTRLALEFAFQIGDQARVLEGRCFDYGEGMTYWPVKEIVRQAADVSDGDSREQARAKIGALLPADDAGRLVADRVASAVGLGDTAAGPEETFWGVRRFLEALGKESPLVVILQDLHWAEPTLLDLVEYLANWSREAPILLVCLARPELLELRPSWAAGIPHAILSTLEPLTAAESEQLIAHLLGEVPLAEQPAARVQAAAEGNPLFVEEMLRMLVDEGLIERTDHDWRAAPGLGDVPIPATIHALLAARLDRLSGEERTLVQRAAVAGKVFWWGAVSELAPPSLRPVVAAVLQTLVRKRVIEPDTASFAGEDAFRFSHVLVRETAYAALPKELRADLHERYALWLEHKAGERSVEFEEMIGYHLERAFRYREELGTATESDRHLALRAGELLGAAGRRAFTREDMPAALTLLDRAVALLTDQGPARLELVRELSSALWAVGELARAETLLA